MSPAERRFWDLAYSRRVVRHRRRPNLEPWPGRFQVAVQAAAALRENEFVTICSDAGPLAADQARSLEMPFLGQKARLLPGVVSIAKLTGAPVLMVFIHRSADYRHQTLEISPPVSMQGDTETAFERVVAAIDAAIQRNPASWNLWFETEAWSGSDWSRRAVSGMRHFAMKATNSECTVVMATYNGAKYLAEQLDSLEQQTAPPARLIISDDGSSDDTKEISASYAKKAAFDVTLVDGPQQGYAENFWSAARLADTRYVAWADQDDVWHPQKIEKCVQALQGSAADFVSHAVMVVDSQLRPLGPISLLATGARGYCAPPKEIRSIEHPGSRASSSGNS